MHSHKPLAVPLGIRVSQPAVSRQAPGLGGRGEQATQVPTRMAQLAPEQLLSDIRATSVNYQWALTKSICQRLNKGICHLRLRSSNPVLLQLPTFIQGGE